MEVRSFTYKLAQAENWTKTKDFHLSCKFNIFGDDMYISMCL